MQESRTFPPAAEVKQRAYINNGQYQKMYDRSVNDPEGFWLEQCAALDWVKKPTVARKYTWNTDARNVKHTWFEDGQLNVTVNCLDRQVKAGRGDKVAILFQGEPEDDVIKLTYQRLREAGRPRFDLSPDDSRVTHRHAGVRAHWGGSFNCFRWVQR